MKQTKCKDEAKYARARKESIRHRLKAGANHWQKFHLRAALLISRRRRFQTVTMKEAKKLVNSGGTAEYELRPVRAGFFYFPGWPVSI